MASIRERMKSNGEISYTVDIRKKNKKPLTATFRKLEDAKLWADYKEDLIDRIDAFDISMGEMMTIEDIFMHKLENAKQTGISPKYITDMISEKKTWEKILGKNFRYIDLTYNFLKELVDKMMTETVRIGGNTYAQDNTGKVKMISPSTVRKRLAYFSSAIEYLKSQGIELRNIPLELLKYFRATYLTNTAKEDEND